MQTAPVGSFKPNAFGLYDMIGNAFEWVEDCVHGSYDGAPTDGSAWIEGGNCKYRMDRGGSWNFAPAPPFAISTIDGPLGCAAIFSPVQKSYQSPRGNDTT